MRDLGGRDPIDLRSTVAVVVRGRVAIIIWLWLCTTICIMYNADYLETGSSRDTCYLIPYHHGMEFHVPCRVMSSRNAIYLSA